MAGKLVVIYPDDKQIHEHYLKRVPDLEQLQRLCGGYVQQIPAMVRYDGKLCRCYADEDGLEKKLPTNLLASRLLRHVHRVVGPMVIEVPQYGHPALPTRSKTPEKPHGNR